MLPADSSPVRTPSGRPPPTGRGPGQGGGDGRAGGSSGEGAGDRVRGEAARADADQGPPMHLTIL